MHAAMRRAVWRAKGRDHTPVGIEVAPPSERITRVGRSAETDAWGPAL